MSQEQRRLDWILEGNIFLRKPRSNATDGFGADVHRCEEIPMYYTTTLKNKEVLEKL